MQTWESMCDRVDQVPLFSYGGGWENQLKNHVAVGTPNITYNDKDS